jgi:hypothetical protein
MGGENATVMARRGIGYPEHNRRADGHQLAELQEKQQDTSVCMLSPAPMGSLAAWSSSIC